MDKISGIPVPTLTDREILLLTYQHLQTVSEDFKSYKTANDSVLRDLQERLGHLEQYMSTAEAIKKESETRTKKQVTVIGVVVTLVNFIVSMAVQIFTNKI